MSLNFFINSFFITLGIKFIDDGISFGFQKPAERICQFIEYLILDVTIFLPQP